MYWADSRLVEVPATSFPGADQMPENTERKQEPFSLEERLQPLLIVSDSSECNNNLSTYLKEAIYELYGVCDELNGFGSENEVFNSTKNYQQISKSALQLLSLNLFQKNYVLCVGKLLGLLVALSELQFQNDIAKLEGQYLQEYICIILLILLKSSSKSSKVLILPILEDLNLMGVIFKVLTLHITTDSHKSVSYMLLKFLCDLVFEYLYLVENLSDKEFYMLAGEAYLIPTLITNLLENDNFNNYDNSELGNDQDDIGDSKAIAYEIFKLLLLINEQYLMKSYTRPEISNKVFETLLEQPASTIPGFLNLVICYLNREESQILKILILKFLYLIFTTSFTSKLFYLNDLKILVDIFIRELTDMEYDDTAVGNSNRMLTITYLKVMYPLLMFSQLSEETKGDYKNDQIIDLFLYLINMSGSNSSKSIQEEQEVVISKLSSRCLTVPWLKKSSSLLVKNVIPLARRTPSSSLTQTSPKGIDMYQRLENSSQESIGAAFTRVASVRTSTKNDFHRHNTLSDKLRLKSNVLCNNNNIFLATKMSSINISDTNQKQNQQLSFENQEIEADDDGENNLNSEANSSNILNIPSKYMGQSRSASPYSTLVRKAIKKKAPPPPPSASGSFTSSPSSPSATPRRVSQTNSPYGTSSPLLLAKSRSNAPLPDFPSPPPPPPPRRRR